MHGGAREMSHARPSNPAGGPIAQRLDRRGFTIIEVLVVIAILVILLAILVPALSRARAEARNVVCQSNERQLAIAFLAYSSENTGRLPTARHAEQYDWLAGTGAEPPPGGGWLFQKYMHDNARAYQCPEHKNNKLTFSYTSHKLLSGAAVEWFTGAHHLASAPYSLTDHTKNLRRFDGVPMIVEEGFTKPSASEAAAGETLGDDAEPPDPKSDWVNKDTLTNRHGRARTVVDAKSGAEYMTGGFANVGYHDGHVSRVSLPAGHVIDHPELRGPCFYAETLCIRVRGGKWISGRIWSLQEQLIDTGSNNSHATLDDAPPASQPPPGSGIEPVIHAEDVP
jgi:prepilin-type N-terminal cleavage/methylation domain-containing protein/prepilin-type processing-associated H-X9-DG protein